MDGWLAGTNITVFVCSRTRSFFDLGGGPFLHEMLDLKHDVEIWNGFFCAVGNVIVGSRMVSWFYTTLYVFIDGLIW